MLWCFMGISTNKMQIRMGIAGDTLDRTQTWFSWSLSRFDPFNGQGFHVCFRFKFPDTLFSIPQCLLGQPEILFWMFWWARWSETTGNKWNKISQIAPLDPMIAMSFYAPVWPTRWVPPTLMEFFQPAQLWCWVRVEWSSNACCWRSFQERLWSGLTIIKLLDLLSRYVFIGFLHIYNYVYIFIYILRNYNCIIQVHNFT